MQNYFSPWGRGLVWLPGWCPVPAILCWHWQCLGWHLCRFLASLGRARSSTIRSCCPHKGKRCHHVAFADGRCVKLTWTTSQQEKMQQLALSWGTGSEFAFSVLARAHHGKSLFDPQLAAIEHCLPFNPSPTPWLNFDHAQSLNAVFLVLVVRLWVRDSDRKYQSTLHVFFLILLNKDLATFTSDFAPVSKGRSL